jgi:hypothetical protein
VLAERTTNGLHSIVDMLERDQVVLSDSRWIEDLFVESLSFLGVLRVHERAIAEVAPDLDLRPLFAEMEKLFARVRRERESAISVLRPSYHEAMLLLALELVPAKHLAQAYEYAVSEILGRENVDGAREIRRIRRALPSRVLRKQGNQDVFSIFVPGPKRMGQGWFMRVQARLRKSVMSLPKATDGRVAPIGESTDAFFERLGVSLLEAVSKRKDSGQ